MYLNTPLHQLHLKINAVYAIQHNLSVEKGLVLNRRVRIVASLRRFVEVQISNTTETHCLPRITFASNPGGSNWTVNRTLRAAYATTFKPRKLSLFVTPYLTYAMMRSHMVNSIPRYPEYKNMMVLEYSLLRRVGITKIEILQTLYMSLLL
jgi:hypothetical protein